MSVMLEPPPPEDTQTAMGGVRRSSRTSAARPATTLARASSVSTTPTRRSDKARASPVHAAPALHHAHAWLEVRHPRHAPVTAAGTNHLTGGTPGSEQSPCQ